MIVNLVPAGFFVELVAENFKHVFNSVDYIDKPAYANEGS